MLLQGRLECLLDSICDVLCERFRRHRVPAFFINQDPSVKLAEQEVPASVELLDVLRLQRVSLLILLKDLSLGPLRNVMLVRLFPVKFAVLAVIWDLFLGDFDRDEGFLRIQLALALVYQEVNLVVCILHERVLPALWQRELLLFGLIFSIFSSRLSFFLLWLCTIHCCINRHCQNRFLLIWVVD